MIEIKGISKNFDGHKAVDNVSVSIKENTVFGLIGTNGAGKSTLLRMVSGILKPDAGYILIDDRPVFDNTEAKKDIFFISDEPYFFTNGNASDMQKYFSVIYPEFDTEQYYQMLDNFGLAKRRKISTFSKGMKKQLALICGVCSKAKYLLCDEAFDGLDPVMRQGMKSIFADEMEKRGLTPVIASHNLRELEDICDHVGLLHKGGVLLSKELLDMKCNIQKVQCVFSSEEAKTQTMDKLTLMKADTRGQLNTLTVRGSREEVLALFGNADTVFYEVLPLSLEEIFISETEVVGYDIKKLILG
ncbi:MAG: ABC transporter ATP-binding protein [Lachnospiraceae bacterium]|nr:ABC transporter ATP-binding protein [Lachnospiraceae bacterium]